MSRGEVIEKLDRMRSLLKERDLEAIILKKGANIAWAIGGRAHVPTTLEMACMDLVIRQDGIEVITNKIAPAVVDELNTWAEKLGVTARI